MNEPTSPLHACRRVLIDSDTGIDDAVAVVLALAEPRLDVVAATTVFGNASVQDTTTNTLALLALSGAVAIPVARGAAAGLIGTPSFAPEVHGPDGVGGHQLAVSRAAVSEPAAELIVRCAHEQPGLSIIALGPLTNVALALHLDPQIAELVEEVVWMGGTLTAPGNVTPVAEADALHDPEAADVVLAAPWRVVIVGLDVTTRALIGEPEVARLAQASGEAGRYLAQILPYYLDFYERRLGRRQCAMHSALTVAVAATPSLVTRTVHGPAGIELAGARTRGMLIVERRVDERAAWAGGRRDATVVLDVDLPAFTTRMLDLICSYPVAAAGSRPVTR